MLSLNSVTVRFGGHLLFNEVSFLINKGDRIGLVGKNGAGKSTLLKVIGGKLRPDEGEVSKPTNFKIGHLTQDLVPDFANTVMEECRKAFAEAIALEEQINIVQKEITERTDYESADYLGLIDKLTEAQHRFNVLDGYRIPEKIERVLRGLGFDDSEFDKKVGEFSGGWQMRIELAKILLQEPDLIMLDEPTNHLDIDSIIWLENFLINYPYSTILVSHDKEFLDNVTNRTIEIANQKIDDYRCNYTKYLELRKDRREKLLASQANQDKQIQQMERNIERFKAKASKASFAQSLMKKLDKIDRIEVDEDDINEMNLKFSISQNPGKVIFKGTNINKSYGNKKVIQNASFEIERGDTVAFVGKNGMGKTTLTRIMANDLTYEGNLEIGHNVQLGYYAQHQADMMQSGKTVLEEMETAAMYSDKFPYVRHILGAFLFSGDDVYKKVQVLSGGERSRLALAKLLIEPYNTLILDEPTNHLDIRSKEILKRAIKSFEGTTIVVSHDREFLYDLCNKIFEFTPEGIKEYKEDFREFLNRKNVSGFRDLMAEEKKEKGKKKEVPQVSASANSVSRRELEKNIKRIKNAIQRAEQKIEELEKGIEEIDNKFQDPEQYKKLINDKNLLDKYELMKQDVVKATSEWEKLVEELTALEIQMEDAF